MVKRNLQILFINIGFITLFAYWSIPGFTIEQFLNITFYFMLIYMIMSLATYTIKGGFYDGIAFGLRRFYSVMAKHKDPLEEWREKPPLSSKINQTFFRVVRFQWIALLVLVVILIMIYNN